MIFCAFFSNLHSHFLCLLKLRLGNKDTIHSIPVITAPGKIYKINLWTLTYILAVFSDFNLPLLKWDLLFWGNLCQKMLTELKGAIIAPSCASWSSLFSVASDSEVGSGYSVCQPLWCLFIEESWQYSVNWDVKRLRVQNGRSHVTS